MKKKISLPVMAVSAILLLGGCGTQMYDLSEDEENLVVQYIMTRMATKFLKMR